MQQSNADEKTSMCIEGAPHLNNSDINWTKLSKELCLIKPVYPQYAKHTQVDVIKATHVQARQIAERRFEILEVDLFKNLITWNVRNFLINNSIWSKIDRHSWPRRLKSSESYI